MKDRIFIEKDREYPSTTYMYRYFCQNAYKLQLPFSPINCNIYALDQVMKFNIAILLSVSPPPN